MADRHTLAGTVDHTVMHSRLLDGNPLGDPADRPLLVYSPPQARAKPERRLPSVYLLQGFGGRLDEWEASDPSGGSMMERFDSVVGREGGAPAILVFVDAATRWGGSQFLNSAANGPYMDYLCDEVVPFVDARYPTLADPRHRGVCGKSSGGYGALVLSMLRPELFGGLVSLAGDALFECCYQPLFPKAARALRDHFAGSWDAFEQEVQQPGADWRTYAVLFAAYGMGCAYTPDPRRPGKPLLPFDAVGRPVAETWSRWLALDPTRLVARYAKTLRSMRHVYLEAGRNDEFFLDLGAQAIARELEAHGVTHTLRLIEGNHDAVDASMPAAVRDLAAALQ